MVHGIKKAKTLSLKSKKAISFEKLIFLNKRTKNPNAR